MRFALLLALASLACAADPVLLPDAGPCSSACGAGTVCQSGACVAVDAGSDAGGIVDLGAPEDRSQPVDLGAPDVGFDAGTPVDVGSDAGAADVGTPDAGRCPAGFADCDGNAANGCEVDTRVGVDHLIPGVPAPNNVFITDCGRCGAPNCGGGNHHRAACTDGSCLPLSCETGYFDCDGMAGNSCESRLRERENCGVCGTVCAAGESCVNGPLSYRCMR